MAILGECPNCDTPIFKIRHGKLDRPMGNFREMRFILADGTRMVMPLCLDCYNAWNSSMHEAFKDRLCIYLRHSVPNQLGSERAEVCINKMIQQEIQSFEKLGTIHYTNAEDGKLIWN